MKRIPKLPVFASLVAFLFIASCAKIASTDIGGDLLPAVDNVNTFDTVLHVISDNKLLPDTTRMLYGENHALGLIDNDQEFGSSAATIYASFTPTSYRAYPFANRDSVIIDSVILSLSYSGTFGDSNSVQQFDVREVDPTFPFRDSLYALNREDFPVTPEIVGTRTASFVTLNDPVEYRNGTDTVRTTNELRIALDTAWGRRFVNYDTTNAYRNDSLFKSHFRGIEVRPNDASPVKKALAYFDLTDNTRSRITFYCRVENGGKTDTIAPYFTYTDDPQANIIRRTPANDYLINVSNAVENDEKIYLQAAPGSYVSIKVPGLENLSNRVIHRAELILEQHPSLNEFYAPPQILFIDAINHAGDSSFMIPKDFMLSNSGPGYDLASLGGILKQNRYVFNLSRYVQSIVTKGQTNLNLRVFAPFYYYLPTYMFGDDRMLIINDKVASGRVVLYGGGNPDSKKMRLRIIYSNL